MCLTGPTGRILMLCRYVIPFTMYNMWQWNMFCSALSVCTDKLIHISFSNWFLQVACRCFWSISRHFKHNKIFNVCITSCIQTKGSTFDIKHCNSEQVILHVSLQCPEIKDLRFLHGKYVCKSLIINLLKWKIDTLLKQ